MKTSKAIFFNSIKKYYHIILIIALVFFYLSSDKWSNSKMSKNPHEVYSNNDSKKIVSISLYIPNKKKIRVNDKEILAEDFEKEIVRLTKKYSTKEISGFTYNVYAQGSIKKGFVTDLFEIVRATQNELFDIKRVLHSYGSI